MQVFFAISCLLAVLVLSNGASIAPTSEKEVVQSSAGVEAQDAVASVGEVRQVAETVSQSRTIDAQANEEGVAVADSADVGAVESSSGNEEADGAVREKRTLLIHQLLRRITCRGGCSGNGGCGSGSSGCGAASSPQAIVVHQDVPVVHPVPIHVPVIKVVHQDVPVPHPVAVPVVKVVRVPVPVISQANPCCGQAPQQCSPCSG